MEPVRGQPWGGSSSRHHSGTESGGVDPDLPEDLWRHVLGKLSAAEEVNACALVCRSWRDIVRSRVVAVEAPARDFFQGDCFGFRAVGHFPALTSLKISAAGSVSVSQSEGEGQVPGSERLSSLKSLKTLHVAGGRRCTSGPTAGMVGDTTVHPLPASFGCLTFLEELVLEEIPWIGSLEPLARLRGLKSLLVLGCPNAVLPRELPLMTSLQALTLKGFTHVPEVICSLTSLRTLAICGSDCIVTLPGLSQLVNLERLDVSHCTALKKLPEGLEKLPRLERLNIFGCPKLCASAVEALRRACPKLQVLRAWPVTSHLVALIQRAR